MPDKVVQEWAQIQGTRICFQHAGRGPALVLVHGLLGYSFSWRFAVPLLSEGREVFAPDMPGSGFSDCVIQDCRLRASADRLLAFLDAVGITSCDLVGSSYGGATAVMAAAIAPAKICSVILVSPANPWSRNGRRRLALLKNPLASAVFPGMARPLRWMHAYFHCRMYGDARRIAPDTIGGYRRALARPGVFEHAVGIVQSWKTDMEELQATLPKIAHLPTLLIWGSRDRVVDPASAEVMGQRLPHAEIAIMEGAGHLPYEECPQEFCPIALDFLDRHSPPASLTRQANPSTSPRREVT